MYETTVREYVGHATITAKLFSGKIEKWNLCSDHARTRGIPGNSGNFRPSNLLCSARQMFVDYVNRRNIDGACGSRSQRSGRVSEATMSTGTSGKRHLERSMCTLQLLRDQRRCIVSQARPA